MLHAGFVYLHVMHDLFGSAPLNADAWAEAVLAALVVVPAVAAEKSWRRRREVTAGSPFATVGGTGATVSG